MGVERLLCETVKLKTDLVSQVIGWKNIKIDWLVGWLVGFYGISTLVGYLIPNALYTYSPSQLGLQNTLTTSL